MALQSNPQWDAENGVCEATSSGTNPSPTTKSYVDLRVHPHLRGYKRRKLLQAPVPMLIGVVHIPIKGTKKTKKVKALVDSGASHCFLVTSIAKHFKRSSSLGNMPLLLLLAQSSLRPGHKSNSSCQSYLPVQSSKPTSMFQMNFVAMI
jgi:hypothetical protein